MSQLNQRFQGLSHRERFVLGLGTIATMAIVVYAFAWQPWQDELNRLRKQVPLQQETLQWMQQQSTAIAPMLQKQKSVSRSGEKPLLTVIEQSARQHKIDAYIRRMSPAENNQVKIWLTDVDFNQWIVWLEKMRGLGIEVNTATVNRGKNNKVTVRVTLQR